MDAAVGPKHPAFGCGVATNNGFEGLKVQTISAILHRRVAERERWQLAKELAANISNPEYHR